MTKIEASLRGAKPGTRWHLAKRRSNLVRIKKMLVLKSTGLLHHSTSSWFAMTFVVLFFIIFITPVFANSSYVLPYPSVMPGSSFYKIHVFFEKLVKYWYFGNFGQFEYNLKESDKYLVEAKTLFEYNQYLLGYKALQESDTYFQRVKPYLIAAQKEGKPIAEKQKLLQEAIQKHIEVLEKIKNNIPETFYWQPEKSNSTQLDLWRVINKSGELRKKEL